MGKIEKFSNWLLNMKGNEYNPDRGDFAFIITQSSVIPRKTMDILKESNIELYRYKTPEINETVCMDTSKIYDALIFHSYIQVYTDRQEV